VGEGRRWDGEDESRRLMSLPPRPRPRICRGWVCPGRTRLLRFVRTSRDAAMSGGACSPTRAWAARACSPRVALAGPSLFRIAHDVAVGAGW